MADTIELDADTLDRITRWDKDHGDEYPMDGFAILEATIRVSTMLMGQPFVTETYYRLTPLGIELKVSGEGEVWCDTVYGKDAEFHDRSIHPHAEMLSGEKGYDLKCSAVLAILAVNRFIVHFEDEPDYVQARTHQRKINKKGKKSKGTRRVVYVTRSYQILAPEDMSSLRSAKHYERHTKGWSVRGHYRYNPKTGKKDIWIPPYPKGDLRSTQSKTYRIKK